MLWKSLFSLSRSPKIWRTPKKKFARSILRKLSSIEKDDRQIRSTRNIGIMAHIDAGKTTTTERMLFYSGVTNIVGEVHDGNTVMDYMDQERTRGITITSASISFPWRKHLFNLIDTPGHVDFTIEVERALRVLDGAVAIFDASAGVEAQSLTVWIQADRYNLPRICFLNKMDKESADLTMCLRAIEKKLNAKVLVLQRPLGQGKSFHGVVDLINMTLLDWSKDKDEYGKNFDQSPLSCDSDKELWHSSLKMRSELVEELADLDNELAEVVLEKESTDLILPDDMRKAIRRITLSRGAIPLLMGSAYKNIGVQPLMDAICDYLPSPIDRYHPKVELYAPALCAVAFKIIHHKHKGVMTFIRVYSGSIEQTKRVFNANQNISEKISKLFIAHADDFHEVSVAHKGSIVVATGFKFTVTGDTLVSSEAAVLNAHKKLEKDGETAHGEILMGVPIPEPVFMCSIEAPSISQQKNLDFALQCLQKEDPSLRVKVEEENGQTVLAGMGELHLQVIKDRICKEYKIEAELGPLQISYRESLSNYTKHSVDFVKDFGEVKHHVKITLSLEPCVGHQISDIPFDYTKENLENLQKIRKPQLDAIKRGIKAALLAGPILHFPVIDVKPHIHWLEVGRKTAETMVAAAASQCVHEIFKRGEMFLLEPVMRVEITVPEEKSSDILGDLAKRRAQIIDIGQWQDIKIISAHCPTAELVGFTSRIRALSSGLANLSMEFAFHQRMSDMECSQVINSLAGY